MKLLLDTHALLWWLADDARLGRATRETIADRANVVLVSVVSLWEIAVKVRIGKLDADVAEIVEAVDRQDFTLLGIDPAHLAALGRLPLYPDHRDPFDHLLVAQGIAEAATFITEDGNASRYAIARITCSDSPRIG